MWPLALFAKFGVLLRLERFLAWCYPNRPIARRQRALSIALLFLFVAMLELAHLEPLLSKITLFKAN